MYLGDSIVQDDQVIFFTVVINILCILFPFGKVKLMMIKLLPTPGALPNPRITASLAEG